MRLNTKKIQQIRLGLGVTWQQIAEAMGHRFRQHAYDRYRQASIKSAEPFARAFTKLSGIKFNPKDFII